MNEVLTMEEIEERFDGEWVLLEDPELTEALHVTKAKLLWHSKDHDEIWRKAQEFDPVNSAVLFIGRPPDDIDFIL